MHAAPPPLMAQATPSSEDHGPCCTTKRRAVTAAAGDGRGTNPYFTFPTTQSSRARQELRQKTVSDMRQPDQIDGARKIFPSRQLPRKNSHELSNAIVANILESRIRCRADVWPKKCPLRWRDGFLDETVRQRASGTAATRIHRK